jgi:hypothetical protein
MCRELEKSPTLLIAALPASPAQYAALPASFAPRPRTVKMVCSSYTVDAHFSMNPPGIFLPLNHLLAFESCMHAGAQRSAS